MNNLRVQPTSDILSTCTVCQSCKGKKLDEKNYNLTSLKRDKLTSENCPTTHENDYVILVFLSSLKTTPNDLLAKICLYTIQQFSTKSNALLFKSRYEHIRNNSISCKNTIQVVFNIFTQILYSVICLKWLRHESSFISNENFKPSSLEVSTNFDWRKVDLKRSQSALSTILIQGIKIEE